MVPFYKTSVFERLSWTSGIFENIVQENYSLLTSFTYENDKNNNRRKKIK